MQVIIGKRSDGADYAIEISESNLFVSYVESRQIEALFKKIITNAQLTDQIFVSASLESRLSDIPKTVLFNSDVALLNRAYKELSKRNKVADMTNRRPIFILIENVWNWVMLANRKTRSNKLAELLTIAPDCKIFMVCASAISLRNLLTQLIEDNPKLEQRLLHKNYHRPIGALGAELIYTTEEFVFYKKKGEPEFERLY